MVSMLASSAVYRGFEPWSRQTKDYEIGICCFSTKHAASRRKSKDWLVRNQNNVSEWNDMSTSRLLFQWASTIKIQLSVLVYNKADLIIISLKINLFSPWYSWKIAELALNNNHSLTWIASLHIKLATHHFAIHIFPGCVKRITISFSKLYMGGGGFNHISVSSMSKLKNFFV